MKKIITLLLVMCSLSVKAQEYTPLVREGVKWECVSEQIGYWEMEPVPFSIYFEGDTIANDIEYKKCYIETGTAKFVAALMREDIVAKQVFVYYPASFYDDAYKARIHCHNQLQLQYEKEYLLYDFNEIYNSAMIADWESSTNVAETGYIAVGDKQCKRSIVTTDSSVNSEAQSAFFSIIEGVGFVSEAYNQTLLHHGRYYEGIMLDFLAYDQTSDGWTMLSCFNRLVADDGTVLYESPNTYTPLVREGVKWECVLDVWKPELQDGPNYFHYPYTIQLEGDTVINGKNYKQCFYRFIDKDVATSDIPRAFLREDPTERKVYCIDNPDFRYYVADPSIYCNAETFGGEYLLYDFANPANKEQIWYMHDDTTVKGSVVEVGDKQLAKHEVTGLSLIESIGYAGSENYYENYCFHGDLLAPVLGYMPCLCQTSYPTFRRFVDENDNVVYSVPRVETDNSYIPLVREGVKWNCVMHKTYSTPSSPEKQDSHSYYSIEFKGDTIINDIAYKKCYYVFDDETEPSNTVPRAFLREDVLNKKVYVIYNDKYTCDKGVIYMEDTPGEEYLLYDFDDMGNSSPIWRDNFVISYYTDVAAQVNGSESWPGYAINAATSPTLVSGIGLVGGTATWADLLTKSLNYPDYEFAVRPQFLNLEDADGNIIYTASEYNNVESIAADAGAVETARYDLTGRRLSRPAPGVNIVRMSDGSTHKVFVK